MRERERESERKMSKFVSPMNNGSGHRIVEKGWVFWSQKYEFSIHGLNESYKNSWKVRIMPHVLQDKFPFSKITLHTGDRQVSSYVTQVSVPGSER